MMPWFFLYMSVVVVMISVMIMMIVISIFEADFFVDRIAVLVFGSNAIIFVAWVG